MDKDRVEGIGHQIKGAIKEGVGKITGDTQTQAEGAAGKDRRQGSEHRRRCEGFGSRRPEQVVRG